MYKSKWIYVCHARAAGTDLILHWNLKKNWTILLILLQTFYQIFKLILTSGTRFMEVRDIKLFIL